MKRAAIFLNGDRLSKKRILKFVKKTDTIICADGGARHAVGAGLVPDIVLGDFDSTPKLLQRKLEKQKVMFLKFPTDKDQTDSEIAINYALSQGFKEIVVIGISGSRLDHMLGSLLFIAHHTKDALITVVEKIQVLFVLGKGELVIKGEKGDYVSLIPIDPKTIGISTTGLKYVLHDALLPYGNTLGISNELSQKKAKVTVSYGCLLVIHTDEKE